MGVNKKFQQVLNSLPVSKEIKKELVLRVNELVDDLKGGGGDDPTGAVIKAVWIFDNDEIVDTVPITGEEVLIDLVPYSDRACAVFTNNTTAPINSYDDNVIVCIYKSYTPSEYTEFNHRYTNSDLTSFDSNGVSYRVETAQDE